MLDYLYLLTKYSAITRCQQAMCNDCYGGVLGANEFKDLVRQARLNKAQRTGKEVRPVQIAAALGISRAAYSHWEKGRSRPKDVETAARLAAYLGVSLKALGLKAEEMALAPKKTKSGLPIEEGQERPHKRPKRRKRKGE